MKLTKKAIILIILIIGWISVIFVFSNQSSIKSNNNSINTIKNVVSTTSKITNDLNITNTDLSDKNVTKIANDLNYPFRKLMHFSEYFILGLLIILLFKELKIDIKYIFILSIVICFTIASVDEFHQLFVGRTGQIQDVLLDTSGSLLVNIIYLIIYKIKGN